MKTLIIAVLTMATSIISAQNTVNWVGGTPGKETAWNEPKNWSDHRVPDEFSDVFIADVSTTTFSFPVIKNGKVELNALNISPDAKLTVNEGAQLIIHDYTEGATDANLDIKGNLFLIDGPEVPSHKATAQQ